MTLHKVTFIFWPMCNHLLILFTQCADSTQSGRDFKLIAVAVVVGVVVAAAIVLGIISLFIDIWLMSTREGIHKSIIIIYAIMY